MYRMQVFEYVPKYKRFNRIHDDKVNIQSTVTCFRLINALDNGYKVVLQPVDPMDYWSDVD